MYVTLFRGITVKPGDASVIKTRILTTGLTNNDERWWQFECVDLRSQLPRLITKTDLTTKDTRPSEGNELFKANNRKPAENYPSICACGDILGASYYALKHNYNQDKGNTHGLIITLRTEIADIQVDGRDFLYNFVFRDAKTSKQRDLACEMFGSRLGLYLDRAMRNPDLSYKFAMCDLAIQDEEVIQAHAKNNIIIGGRHGTVFKSAFFVKIPIPASNIISVEDAEYQDFTPDVTINSFTQMGNA